MGLLINKALLSLAALMLLVLALSSCSGRVQNETDASVTTQTTYAIITEPLSTAETVSSETALTSAEPTAAVQATQANTTSVKATTAKAKATTVKVEKTTKKPTATTTATTTAFSAPAVPLKKITELEDVKVETLRYGVVKETHTIVTYMLYSDGSHVDEERKSEVIYNRSNFNPSSNELAKYAAINKSNQAADIKKAVELVNDYRKAYKIDGVNRGLKPLEYDGDLTLAACIRAEEIAYSGEFSHTRPGGRPSQSVLDDIGYRYSFMGENLSRRYETPQAAFEAWVDSPEHLRNIVEDDFTKIGIGYAVGPDGVVYWVQLFAA